MVHLTPPIPTTNRFCNSHSHQLPVAKRCVVHHTQLCVMPVGLPCVLWLCQGTGAPTAQQRAVAATQWGVATSPVQPSGSGSLAVVHGPVPNICISFIHGG